uniref:Interleukin 6 cytokine family signal transducer n=1 Tax=Panthera tigris altaica TaxID=74533 RepID=A0A8C9JAZ2_PANTA
MLTLKTWIVQALFIFFTTESVGQRRSLLIVKQNVTPLPHALLIILLCILSTLKSG